MTSTAYREGLTSTSAGNVWILDILFNAGGHVYNSVFVIKDGAFIPVSTSGHWLSLEMSKKPPDFAFTDEKTRYPNYTNG